MKKLYFVRHGLSTDNKKGVYSGLSNPALTPEGVTQSIAAGKQAKKLNIDLVVSSPYIRAHETAKLISRHANYPLEKILLNELLIERNLGIMEGHPYFPGKIHDQIEGVESTSDVIKRAQEAIDWLHSLPANNILIVSHGSFGRGIRTVINPKISFSELPSLENAKIIRIL
jgi:uncharacterized phosphatase